MKVVLEIAAIPALMIGLASFCWLVMRKSSQKRAAKSRTE